LKYFIKDISYENNNLLETIDIDYIVINDLNMFNLIKDNQKNILDIKIEESWVSGQNFKKLYRFFRINDKKLYTIVKNFKRFYYVEDVNGEYTAIDGKKCSKCYDYYLERPNHYEKDINIMTRYALEKSKLGKINIGKNYRRCYIDIETNSCVDSENPTGEILSIVCQDSLTTEVRTWNIDPARGDLLEQEIKMLEECYTYLQDMDVILGWNTGKFDLPYLINRGIRINADTSLMSIVNAQVSCKYLPDDRINSYFVKIIGVNLLDMMPASARSLAYLPEKLRDNKLDTVAEAILGEKKIHTDTPSVLFKNGRIQELLDYNIQDVLLLMKLDDKIGISNLMIATVEIVPGLSFESANYNSKVIDFYLLSKFNIIMPSVNSENVTDIEGAVVFEPISGVHNDVCVFDIAGMYGNLVRSFNISPDCLIDKPEKDCVKIHTDRCGDCYYTTSKKGILVNLVDDLTVLRKKYKNAMAEHINDSEYDIYYLRQLAIKKIISSVYGVFGYRKFRLFSNKIANSITAAGRELLNYMKDFAVNNNNIVVSGDTDSIFIKNKEGKSNEYFNKLIVDMNNSLGNFVAKFTTSDNFIKNHKMEIEYETFFTKLIIAPAKKKYIGLVTKMKGKDLEKPIIYSKGSELVKKDVPDFIKKEIKDMVLDVLLDENTNIDNIVRKIKVKIVGIKERIFKADFSELLIWKEINKDFNSYKVKPQTVRGAESSNEFLGTDYSRQNYKGGVLHVAPNNKGVEVFFLNQYDNFNDSKFKVNYEKYYDKYVLNKINLIFGKEIYDKVTQKNKLLSEFTK
jgi:DNA polymerase elongation subunit (family B)